MVALSVLAHQHSVLQHFGSVSVFCVERVREAMSGNALAFTLALAFDSPAEC